MNAVDVVLQDDLGQLMERLAGAVPAGSLAVTSTTNPTLRLRLDEMEVSLARARAALLEDYGRWRRTLDDLENLWALASWSSAGAEQAADHAPARAA